MAPVSLRVYPLTVHRVRRIAHAGGHTISGAWRLVISMGLAEYERLLFGRTYAEDHDDD